MYPDWQFLYWLRSIFWKRSDFVYRDENTGQEVKPGAMRRKLIWLLTASALASIIYAGPERITRALHGHVRNWNLRTFVKTLKV